MNVSDLLDGKRVCVCVGSGGVGKTTTSAAIALGAAAAGRRVAVVTIDPARRLADSLGLAELGNEPARVDPALLSAAGLEVTGELWALMLDPKRTFDDVIGRLAPDDRTRDEILANPVYKQLSSAVAGSQEYTAMSKLYDLVRETDFDLIVLDTPPSRNALDFIEAPDRLTAFLEGRALKMFLRPTGIAARVVGRGAAVVFGALRRVTGVSLLEDLTVFFTALTGLLDGFRDRAAGVNALLADRRTTFVLVTSPEPEPVEEGLFFLDRLRAAKLPFGGLIVNRVHHDEVQPGKAGRSWPRRYARRSASGSRARWSTTCTTTTCSPPATAMASLCSARWSTSTEPSWCPRSTMTSTTSAGWSGSASSSSRARRSAGRCWRTR